MSPRALTVILLIGCLSACKGESGGFSEPTFIETADPLKLPDQSNALRFSVVSLENPLELAEGYHPLLKHLAEKLGRHVIFIPVRDNEQLVQALVKREVDFAQLAPQAYFDARGRAEIRVLVRQQKKDGGGVTGVIVVRNDSPVKSLKDLKGKSFAFGDPKSTFASSLPRYLLKEAGVNPGDFSRTEQLGSMDNCAQNVLNGAYAATGIRDSIYEKFRSRAIGLRVIARSQKYPGEPIVAREGLSADLADSIRRTLLGIRDPEILESIAPDQGVFVPAAPGDYDVYKTIE